MRILIASGGTGGHFYPAWAVARVLRERGHEVIFCGRFSDRQRRLLKENGVRAWNLPVRGMDRTAPWKWPVAAVFAVVSTAISFALHFIWPADVCLCLGGYASFPAAFACRLTGVPVVIHEPNARPGWVARFLARKARKISVGMEPAKEGFLALGVSEEKIAVTGTPVRPEFNGSARPRPLEKALRRILVLGGSRGARPINAALVRLAEKFVPLRPVVDWTILTGPEDQAEVDQTFSWHRFQAAVQAYSESIHTLFGQADLVIARAGASTCAEIAASGCPAVLIPLPASAGDHQEANAKYLEAHGAAVTLQQREMDQLPRLVQDLLSHPEKLGAMSQAAASLHRPEAAKKVADLVESSA